MVYRLCRLPLNLSNYTSEYTHIKETARVNGYTAEMVDKLIRAHSNKKERDNLTTLFSQRELVEERRVPMVFIPQTTNKLETKFKEHKMQIVYKSGTKLLNVLCPTKNTKSSLSKSGI